MAPGSADASDPAAGQSPAVQAAFARLRSQFLAGLPQRWAEIVSTPAGLSRAAALHRLTGAAGGFGLTDREQRSAPGRGDGWNGRDAAGRAPRDRGRGRHSPMTLVPCPGVQCRHRRGTRPTRGHHGTERKNRRRRHIGDRTAGGQPRRQQRARVSRRRTVADAGPRPRGAGHGGGPEFVELPSVAATRRPATKPRAVSSAHQQELRSIQSSIFNSTPTTQASTSSVPAASSSTPSFSRNISPNSHHQIY